MAKLNFNGVKIMKLIKKKAEFVGYTVYSVGTFPEWRCPDKDCGMSVMEEYKCCPYCGRRLKFDKSRNLNNKNIQFHRKVREKDYGTDSGK